VDSIELKYQKRIDALTPKDRVARAAAIFQWTREAIARQIVTDSGASNAASVPADRSPKGRGGERPSAALPFLDDVPHRLRRGALHLPARRSRQNVHVIHAQTLNIIRKREKLLRKTQHHKRVRVFSAGNG
jgi:hypothetical protein